MITFTRNGHNRSILVKRAGNDCATIQKAGGVWKIIQHGSLQPSGSMVTMAGQRTKTVEFIDASLTFFKEASAKEYDSLPSAMQALIVADPKTTDYDCTTEARALLVGLCKYESPSMLTVADVALAKTAWKPRQQSNDFTPVWA